MLVVLLWLLCGVDEIARDDGNRDVVFRFIDAKHAKKVSMKEATQQSWPWWFLWRANYAIYAILPA